MLTPVLDQVQTFLNFGTYWCRKTPLDWHQGLVWITPNSVPSIKATQKRLLKRGYLKKATQKRLLKRGYSRDTTQNRALKKGYINKKGYLIKLIYFQKSYLVPISMVKVNFLSFTLVMWQEKTQNKTPEAHQSIRWTLFFIWLFSKKTITPPTKSKKTDTKWA